ncbi:hypothetical protein NQ314_003597, partial [Rhamnusium bicolor]
VRKQRSRVDGFHSHCIIFLFTFQSTRAHGTENMSRHELTFRHFRLWGTSYKNQQDCRRTFDGIRVSSLASCSHQNWISHKKVGLWWSIAE